MSKHGLDRMHDLPKVVVIHDSLNNILSMWLGLDVRVLTLVLLGGVEAFPITYPHKPGVMRG